MTPLNMDPEVSAKRPSHQPQPPPLLTLAFTADAYFVPVWQGLAVDFFRGRFTSCDGFIGDFVTCSIGMQTANVRGVC